MYECMHECKPNTKCSIQSKRQNVNLKQYKVYNQSKEHEMWL